MRGSAKKLFALSFLSGCVTGALEYVSVEWRQVDHPNESRIEIRFRNESGADLCGFSDDNWPNAAGQINQDGDTVFLVVGNERFPMEPFNTGAPVCRPKGCRARQVKPGEEIIGYIPYASFKLPARLRYETKMLELHPVAYFCR